MNIQRIPNWYAFVTRPRHEKKVKTYLDSKGISNYLPLRQSLNQWKDRKRWVEAPLFSCYIFANVTFVDRYDVLITPSVVRMVSFNNQPTPIRPEEIDAVKRVLNVDQELRVIDGILPGSRVRIMTGPLCGLEGLLVENRGCSWFVIYVEAIGKSILVDIRENRIEKI